DLISIPYWLEYLPLLGFVRAPWADSATPLGVKYMGHHLDLRHEDLSARLNRMYALMESSTPLEQKAAFIHPKKTATSLEESVKLVQRALKHFSRLPFHPEITLSLQPLLPEASAERKTDKIA